MPESELDQALARVKALAPEKDPALEPEWGSEPEPGLVQAQEPEWGLVQVPEPVLEPELAQGRDPASVWELELVSELVLDLALAQVKELAPERGSEPVSVLG